MDAVTPIELKGFKARALRDQPQPMMIWASLDQLVINRAYQRNITPAGRAAIQRIADGFDWRKFQPILVSPHSGGKMAIVDGQHRAHAAALVGLDAVPAMTVAMSLSEQAAGFAAINRDRINVRPEQIYRAELAAGAAWARDCKAAVEASGCQLATSNPTHTAKRPGIVYSISLVRRMVAAGEGIAVTAGLRAIRGSAAGEDVENYGGAVLAVWLAALARNIRFLSLPLTDVFDSVDIEALFDQARIKGRQTGQSARALVIDEITRLLKEADAPSSIPHRGRG